MFEDSLITKRHVVLRLYVLHLSSIDPTLSSTVLASW